MDPYIGCFGHLPPAQAAQQSEVSAAEANLHVQAIRYWRAFSSRENGSLANQMMGSSAAVAQATAHLIRATLRYGALVEKERQARMAKGRSEEANKRLSKRRPGTQGGKGKEPVFSLVEREGKVRSFHLPDVTAKNLGAVLHAQIDHKSYLMTDSATPYVKIADVFAGHATVGSERRAVTNHPSRSAAVRERELRSAVRELLALHKRRDTFWYRTSSLHVFGEVMDRLAALTGPIVVDEKPARRERPLPSEYADTRAAVFAANLRKEDR